MRNWNTPPKFIMLSLYDDNTYNVDFFDSKEKADGWKEYEEGKNGKYDRLVKCIVYAPVKEAE